METALPTSANSHNLGQIARLPFAGMIAALSGSVSTSTKRTKYRTKICNTSTAPGYVGKFQRALVGSAIATLLSACAGGAGEETGNVGTTAITPEIGAAVEATVDTDTDLIVTGGGSGVEITPDTDSTDIDTVVDVSEVVQTDIEVEVDSDTDTVVIPVGEESTSSIPDSALGLIQSHPELGLFASAIQSSGLVNYLADPQQRVTVFALSDQAFESLSTAQREALFDDPTRLNTIVRATTVTDRRLTESAAGVEDDIRPLANGGLQFDREGDLITITGGSSDAVKVMDTLLDDEVAIHIINDFTNLSHTFFQPDPGSIMEGLLEDGTIFANLLGRTRWYRELGNSERGWTVFEPEDSIAVGVSDIDNHIVADDLNDPITLMAGTLTSVDEQSHVIRDARDNFTIDDIDILEFNALQFNNGNVHRIAFPLGEYISVMSILEEKESDNYTGDEFEGSNYRFKFFAELIRSLGETERYHSRDNRLTLVIPLYAIIDAEYNRLEQAVGVASIQTMYDAFVDQSLAMVPDIFPTTDAARAFLLSHTIEGIVNMETLDSSVGDYLTTASGTSLEITGDVNSPWGITIGGQGIWFDEVNPASNGGILKSFTSLAETPDFSGVNELDFDMDGIPDVDDADADGDGLVDLGGDDNFVDLNGDGLDDITLYTKAESIAGTIIEVSARFPCGSERGHDNSSANNAWNDNCVVKRHSVGGQFADSLFTVGIQRVLFCSGYGTGTDYTFFADGEFGPASESATIAFQQHEALTADGMVDSQTWERLRQRIKLLNYGIVNATPNTYGFTEGVCADIPMFSQDISTADDGLTTIAGGWTLARNQPNEAEMVPFSYEQPFGRL